MKQRSNKLLDQYLAGKSAAYLVEALLDTLPTEQQIRSTLLNVLPHGSDVKIEETEVTLTMDQPDHEAVSVLEGMYPELEFIVVVRSTESCAGDLE